MSTITGGGTDELRRAVLARAKKINISGLAHNIGVAVTALEGFASGRVKLSAKVLQALTLELFNGHVVLDADADLLRPAPKPEPRTLCTAMPDPAKPKPVTHSGATILKNPLPSLRPPAGKRSGWA